LASISPVFVLRTRNAVGNIVVPFTRSMQFTGGAVVTQVSPGNAVINVTGSGSAWDVLGNAGAGLVHGTTTNDVWKFIQNNLERGGFGTNGGLYLKTHPGYADSENYSLTGAVATTDAVPTTIFTLPIPDLRVGFLTVSVQGRKDAGSERASFERKVMFHREGGGAAISTKVHSTFTDKTYVSYDIQIIPVLNNIEIQVTGEAGHNIAWTGSLNYQMVGTP
jgi:hypothetical protein